MLGPNAFLDTEVINFSKRFCREVQGNVGDPFTDMTSYDIGGRFCLVKDRIPPVGPYCLGNTCYPNNSTDFCSKHGGKEFGPFMCALPPGYRRAEGPLIWNDQFLESNSTACNGLFCAILESNPGANLRCPADNGELHVKYFWQNVMQCQYTP